MFQHTYTGPRTPEGLERSRKANLKHGLYSKGFIKEKKHIGAITKFVNEMAKRKIENPIVLDGFAQYLVKLETLDKLKSELVKLRFFAGVTLEQASALLGISQTTAKRYWTYARAWLYREISKGG